MTMPADVDLIASYWTIAGDIDVLGDAISPWDFTERVVQAAAAGYVGFGLNHIELLHLEATLGLEAMRSVFEEHGITIVELEALTDWFVDGEDRAQSDQVRRDLLRAAGALGARHIKVVGTLADDQVDVGPDRMIESFAHLCADAAEVGTTIVIEMLPIGNVSSLDAALHLVEGAGAPNGGLLLDMWHVHRTGTSLEAIAALPAGSLLHVELDDGGPPAPGSAFEDTIRNRKLCGEGEFDLTGFLRATKAAGYQGAYGIEILSTTFRTRELAEMATQSFDTATAVMAAAG
jgi:sugar phosphate isomerase/epimerase